MGWGDDRISHGIHSQEPKRSQMMMAQGFTIAPLLCWASITFILVEYLRASHIVFEAFHDGPILTIKSLAATPPQQVWDAVTEGCV